MVRTRSRKKTHLISINLFEDEKDTTDCTHQCKDTKNAEMHSTSRQTRGLLNSLLADPDHGFFASLSMDQNRFLDT